MTDAVTVAPCAAADLPAIEAFLAALQDHEGELRVDLRAGREVAGEYLAAIRDKSAARSGALLVASRDGEVAGFVCFWHEQDDDMLLQDEARRYGYVSDLFVAPGQRRKGVARALLAAAERHFAALGVTRLRINAIAANAAARALYEAHGFAPLELVFEKRLG